jgi:pimeloyl-ACP methyl ester carboxylesterase
MASSLFRVVDHTVECQHVREYPGATLSGEDEVLHLAVKQYIPKDNPNPQPGDVTILGAHANGFPKELYEPLWEEILTRANADGFRIRSIWIADVAQQGHSGVLNEDLIGDDPSWNDHPRDLLHLINVMKMPRPIVGIGHSMGGNHLCQVAYIHPRLMTTLILIDPVIQLIASTPPESGPSPAQMSTFRRDVWLSREEAAASFKKSPFYKSWDPRVLDVWIKYGLRELPTPIHPEQDATAATKQVTLTCTKHQEVFTFLRPNKEAYGVDGKPANRQTHPDINPLQGVLSPFYRPEPPQVFLRLPELRPSVFYVFGGKSDVGPAVAIRDKMVRTGVGAGGSGGAKEGRVKQVTFDDIGHLIAMEVPGRTADHIVPWLGSEVKRWKEQEAAFKKDWMRKSVHEKRTISKETEKMMGGPRQRTPKSPSKL